MTTIKRTKHDIYPFISATERLRGAAKDKVVLISGGRVEGAIAKQFALAGARIVVITGHDAQILDEARSLIKNAAPGCEVVTADMELTSEDSISKLWTALPEVPDVMINNSGIVSSQTLLADSDPSAWWLGWEVNLCGLYSMTRHLLLALGKAGNRPATIINVSSSVSDIVSRGMSSYGTSKLAVNRLTEAIQLEYGSHGVRALAFHPGGVAETGMGQMAPEQFRSRLIDTVDLAAGTALYLSTPEASYLNGRFVYSNWDMEQVETLKDEIITSNLLVARIDYGDKLSAEVFGLPPA